MLKKMNYKGGGKWLKTNKNNKNYFHSVKYHS